MHTSQNASREHTPNHASKTVSQQKLHFIFTMDNDELLIDDTNESGSNVGDDKVGHPPPADWVMVADSPTIKDDDSGKEEQQEQESPAPVTPVKKTEPTSKDDDDDDKTEAMEQEDLDDKEEEDYSDKGSKKDKAKKKKKAPSTKTDKEGPVTKKPRANPEKVQEVRDKMLNIMVKNYNMGIKTMSLPTLASECGYTNHRSDAIIEAVKQLTKTEDLMTKTKMDCSLTQAAIDEHASEEPQAQDPEQAMEQFWNLFQKKLDSQTKTKGQAAQLAAKHVWDLLKDGKVHSLQDMVDVTSYKARNSSGFEGIMKALKDLEFSEKVGQDYRFTDKMFPFGRPN